jgi:predicted esterase
MRPILRFLTLALLTSGAARALEAQTVTRRDLADTYLMVDRLAMQRGIPESERATWNRDFDRTTLAFFGGDFPRVLRSMHDLVARMVGDSAPASPTRQLLAIRPMVVPRISQQSGASTVTARLTVMYAEPNAPERALVVRLRSPSGAVMFARWATIPAGAAAGTVVDVALDATSMRNETGRYVVEVRLEGAAFPLEAPAYAADFVVSERRTQILREAEALRPDIDAQSRASIRARAALLVDDPDPSNSAQFIADPVQLSRALNGELASASQHGSAYRNSVGDTWRVLAVGASSIPMRLYVPRHKASEAKAVVIALHGAGADENMFFEGYGAGVLRDLAELGGFITASPATTEFLRAPGALDTLLATLEREQSIDRARVYVIGHSMGGAATLRLASEQRQSVRAAVVIAGAGQTPTDGQMAPTLFIGAETDLVIPVTRVRASYDAAKAAGAPVEFVQADGWGHTLVVGAWLGDAVRWLFAH